jgi:hypothetical protein
MAVCFQIQAVQSTVTLNQSKRSTNCLVAPAIWKQVLIWGRASDAEGVSFIEIVVKKLEEN